MIKKVVSKNIRLIIFLALLTFLSLFLRFHQLGKIPNGLTVDEADVGYNAFSILKTGKDVYGRKFPLFFQSFDVFQPSFQIYASIPAVYFLGLTDFSIRITPAILGIIATLLFYFIIKLLYPNKKSAAYLGFLLISLAPWHIAISRANAVTVEVVFLYFLFFLLFLIGIYKNPKFLPLSAIFLGLTIYTYHIALLYLPLLFILFGIIYKRELSKNVRLTLLSILIVLLVILPAVLFYQNPATHNRFNMVSFLNSDATLTTSIEEMQDDGTSIVSKILHNRRLVFANTFLDTYSDYFNIDYLFVNSHDTRYFYTNYVGLFYFIELIFVAYGIKTLLRNRKQSDLLIVGLLLIGPFPAGLALGSPFPHRAPLLLFAIQLTSVVGIAAITKDIRTKKFRYKTAATTIIFLIYALGIFHFMHQYFIHSPKEFTSEFDNGAWFSTVRDVIPQVNQEKTKYDKVIFSWQKSKLVPPVYFLFYNKVDPKIIQSKAALWTNEPPSYKQIYEKIGNIEFRIIDWEKDNKLKNTLFVGYPGEFPKDVRGIISRTYLSNGKEHFILVGNP